MLNIRVIFRILSLVIMITGIAMIPSYFVALARDSAFTEKAFLTAIGITLVTGLLLYINFRDAKGTLSHRDGYMAVALSWLFASLFGALPYWLSWGRAHLIDGFFESVSGFTTTGATVVGLEALDKSLLFWKATASWLGGMGILVFAISLLPALGINGLTIVKAEVPGPVVDKVAPRISSSTKILYFTYGVFTLLEFFLLFGFSQMDFIDSIINTFGSISTGGVFTHKDGLSYYDSPFIEGVIGTFCLLGSVSFLMYFLALKGKFREIIRNTEFKAFLAIIIISALLVSLSLFFKGGYDSFLHALRHGLFQVISCATTAGYGITDFSLWPGLCITLLFLLMLIGGCGSSTSGGLKVIRLITSFKIVSRMFFKRLHPQGVTAVKVGGKAMSADIVSRIASFMMLYFAFYIGSVLILSLDNLDMETTLGIAAGALSNTGLGLGPNGPSGFYGVYSMPLRLYLSFVMLMGRLEIFTVFILFTPAYWRNT